MSDHFNNQAEWTIAKDMYNRAEKGENISDFLNTISSEERVSIAKKMQDISTKGASEGLPELFITFDKDKDGNDKLQDIKLDTLGPFNKDVYDEPASGLVTNATADSNVETAWEATGQTDNGTAKEQIEHWHRAVEVLSPSVAERLGK